MDFARKVDRAAPEQRIPAGGVGRTEKLYFEAHPGRHIHRRSADYPIRSRPCRSAGSAPQHLDGDHNFTNNLGFEYRRAEPSAVFAQAILAGQTTSGRRGDGIADVAAGGNYRNGPARAENGKIFGKVRVL